MNGEILIQLAHSTLLPKSQSAAIFSGTPPQLEELVMALVIGSMDANAVTAGDPKSTWNEIRIARQSLTITFLLAINGAASAEGDRT